MKKIGLISDTHGTFDAPLERFLASVDEIWHAGDIGGAELSDRIAAFKPLRAVYGNVDDHTVRLIWPRFQHIICEDVSVVMTHIGGYPGRYDQQARAAIERLHPNIFISGHSHILKVVNDPKYNLLHINPGAAGYGYQGVRTAVRFTIDGSEIKDLEVGEF